MDKAMINLATVDMNVVTEVTGKNGDVILVKKMLPYAEKEMQAYEVAAASFVINEEDKVCYESYKRPLIETFLLTKYYTNVDVSEYESEEGYEKLYDYLTFNELYDPIMEACRVDYWRHVDEIAWRLKDAATTSYEKKNSFGYKLEQTFGFLFTGEDLTDQIAAAEDVNGKMIDMFKAVQERDAKNALLKNSKAKVNSGGAVLNMAKK